MASFISEVVELSLSSLDSALQLIECRFGVLLLLQNAIGQVLLLLRYSLDSFRVFYITLITYI